MNIEMIEDLFIKALCGSIREKLLKPQDTNSVLYNIAYELGVPADIELILNEAKNIIIDILKDTSVMDLTQNESYINLLTMFSVLLMDAGDIFKGEANQEKINKDLVHTFFED